MLVQWRFQEFLRGSQSFKNEGKPALYNKNVGSITQFYQSNPRHALAVG